MTYTYGANEHIRQKHSATDLTQPLDAENSIDVLKTVNDYTQTYVSPLEQTQTTYQKLEKRTEQSTHFYDTRGTAIGTDLDTYVHDGYGSNGTQLHKVSGYLYSNNLYETFGRSERPIANQAGYRSQMHDDWARQHLRAREYDTTTGRFLQEDTVLGELNNPITQHKYIYANNNPLIYRDDAGRASWLSKAWNTVKKTTKKVAKAVNKYVVQPVVKVVKAAVKTVGKVVKSAGNFVQSFIQNPKQATQQLYNKTTTAMVNGTRHFVNAVEKGYDQAATWVGTKMEQAEAYYQEAKAYVVEQAEATRAKAEARIRKMCESASKIQTTNNKSKIASKSKSTDIEFGTIKIDSKKNSPVKITISEKTVNMDVYAEFKGDTKQKIEDITAKELAKKGIESWAGDYKDVFGEDIHVNVNIYEGKNSSWWEFWNWGKQKYVPITLSSEKGIPHVSSQENKFYYGELNMFYADERGQTPYNKEDYLATVAHEFGHILGLDDAYGSGSRPEAPEIYYSEGVMKSQFREPNISSTDIKMALLAARDKANQYFSNYDGHKESEIFN